MKSRVDIARYTHERLADRPRARPAHAATRVGRRAHSAIVTHRERQSRVIRVRRWRRSSRQDGPDQRTESEVYRPERSQFREANTCEPQPAGRVKSREVSHWATPAAKWKGW